MRSILSIGLPLLWSVSHVLHGPCLRRAYQQLVSGDLPPLHCCARSYQSGLALIILKNLPEAEAELRSAVRLDASWAKAHYLLE